jgi:hypothetical protein
MRSFAILDFSAASARVWPTVIKFFANRDACRRGSIPVPLRPIQERIKTDLVFSEANISPAGSRFDQEMKTRGNPETPARAENEMTG